MLQYERFDVSEGIDINNSDEPHLCNQCHDLSLLAYDLSDFIILNVEGVNYRCYVFNMSKMMQLNC